MKNNSILFVEWSIQSVKALGTSIGTWGFIGAFIITYGLLRKLVAVLHRLWKGGL